MKILTLSLLLLLSAQAHAVVADRFHCTMSLSDEHGTSTKQEQDFFVARLPVSASPAPDVRLTAGELMMDVSLDTPPGELSANLNFYFKHAIRLDAQGKPLEARQLTCFAMSGAYCDHTGTGFQICGKSVEACMEEQNPFDPTNGWTPVSLIDGVPTFSEHDLGGMTMIIGDDNHQRRGIAKLKCLYQGSFQ